jgi:hypothetical protein
MVWTDSDVNRFWAKVQKSEGCWEWVGHRDKDGYGSIRAQGTRIRAHRMAWQLSNEDIPEGLMVLHKCDNPPCCNPAHLYVGGNSDNMKDKFERNRQSNAGIKNAMSKLTDQDILAIRSDPRQHQVIASEYHITPSTVSHILAGAGWRHLLGKEVATGEVGSHAYLWGDRTRHPRYKDNRLCSVGVFKWVAMASRPGTKKSPTIVRVIGLASKRGEVEAKAETIARELDAGTYAGPKWTWV